jgi:metal-responsive CopG/Arc/MetJ family transcriptional regulator
MGHITSMALARKKATTIALEPEMDELLSRAAEERGVSRSEFIRQQLALVLEQFKRHPRPKVAGIIRHDLQERGDEGELYANRRR